MWIQIVSTGWIQKDCPLKIRKSMLALVQIKTNVPSGQTCSCVSCMLQTPSPKCGAGSSYGLLPKRPSQSCCKGFTISSPVLGAETQVPCVTAHASTHFRSSFNLAAAVPEVAAAAGAERAAESAAALASVGPTPSLQVHWHPQGQLATAVTRASRARDCLAAFPSH